MITLRRGNEINSVGIDFDDLRAVFAKPVNHFSEQIAPDLRDARRGVKIGKVSLRKAEVAIETVEQDLERVLQRLKMMQFCRVAFGAHPCLGLQTERAHVAEQVAKDLEPIRGGE